MLTKLNAHKNSKTNVWETYTAIDNGNIVVLSVRSLFVITVQNNGLQCVPRVDDFIVLIANIYNIH
jgi:hypothetical protein